MIQFYEIYKDNQKVRTLSAQLSWSNNLLIIQETKTFEAKEFYIHLCLKNNYSYRELKEGQLVLRRKDGEILIFCYI